MTVRRVSCPSFRFLTVLVLAATLAVASCQTQPFGFPGIPVEALPQRPDDPIPVCDGDIGILLFCVNLHCMNGEKWLKDAEAAEKALDFSWNAFSPRGHALRRMTALCGLSPHYFVLRHGCLPRTGGVLSDGPGRILPPSPAHREPRRRGVAQGTGGAAGGTQVEGIQEPLKTKKPNPIVPTPPRRRPPSPPRSGSCNRQTASDWVRDPCRRSVRWLPDGFGNSRQPYFGSDLRQHGFPLDQRHRRHHGRLELGLLVGRLGGRPPPVAFHAGYGASGVRRGGGFGRTFCPSCCKNPFRVRLPLYPGRFWPRCFCSSFRRIDGHGLAAGREIGLRVGKRRGALGGHGLRLVHGR